MDKKLLLAEELLLLALKDEKGTFATGIDEGLTGSLVIELILLKKAHIGDKKKLEIIDNSFTGDELLDEVLDQILISKKSHTIEDWISKIPGKVKKIKQRLLDRLVDNGILRSEEGKVLWVFNTTHYPAEDMRPELDLRSKINDVVIGGSMPDGRMLVLLALIQSCNLINEVFEKEQRKDAAKRIKSLIKESKESKELADSIESLEAIQAALLITTIIIPTVIVAGANS